MHSILIKCMCIRPKFGLVFFLILFLQLPVRSEVFSFPFPVLNSFPFTRVLYSRYLLRFTDILSGFRKKRVLIMGKVYRNGSWAMLPPLFHQEQITLFLLRQNSVDVQNDCSVQNIW